MTTTLTPDGGRATAGTLTVDDGHAPAGPTAATLTREAVR